MVVSTAHVKWAMTEGKGMAGKTEIVQETVTPSKAREWLATISPTYRFRRNHYDRLRDDMRAGDFHPDSSAFLVIDEAGRLHNGRHRLQAQEKEGKTYTYWVMHCSNEAAARWDLVGDTGTGWTLADYLREIGVKDPNIVGSALTYLHRYYTDSILRTKQPTRTQAVTLLNANKDISEYIRVVRLASREFAIPQGMCAAMAYLASTLPEASEDDITDFWQTLAQLGSKDKEIVATAVSELEHGNPILALGNWLERSRPRPRGSGRRPENLTWAMVLKSWNAYITQDSIQRLRWGRKEKFPAIMNSAGLSFPAGSPTTRELLEG